MKFTFFFNYIYYKIVTFITYKLNLYFRHIFYHHSKLDDYIFIELQGIIKILLKKTKLNLKEKKKKKTRLVHRPACDSRTKFA